VNGLGEIIAQLEKQREAIERALAALRGIESTGVPGKRRGRPPGKKKRWHMSAEGRARIGEAPRRRWAEKRAAEAGAKKLGRPAKKAKRSMSPEGRARIAEAARKMWAEKKAKKAGRKKSAGGE
jgi:hypothetical protein